jgi:hypothetical protein
MLIHHLPSPVKAQRYRVENLYAGPLNDYYAYSVRECDPNGLLVIFIGKMIPGSKKTRSFAFGRVFSGKVKVGMRVRVLGSNHVPGQKDYYVESLQRAEIFEGKKLESTKTVQCGNLVALIGLNKYIPHNATITKECALLAFPFRAIYVLNHDQNLPDITLKATGKSRVENFYLPYLVHDDLFLHQREGLRWLWSMHCQDSGVGVLDRQTYQWGTRGSRLCGEDRDRETENSKVCARTRDTRFIQVRVAKVANPTSCLGDQVWCPALGVVEIRCPARYPTLLYIVQGAGS